MLYAVNVTIFIKSMTFKYENCCMRIRLRYKLLNTFNDDLAQFNHCTNEFVERANYPVVPSVLSQESKQIYLAKKYCSIFESKSLKRGLRDGYGVVPIVLLWITSYSKSLKLLIICFFSLLFVLNNAFQTIITFLHARVACCAPLRYTARCYFILKLRRCRILSDIRKSQRNIPYLVSNGFCLKYRQFIVYISLSIAYLLSGRVKKERGDFKVSNDIITNTLCDIYMREGASAMF